MGSAQKSPADPTTLSPEQQLDLAREMTKDWHPNMRKLIDLTDRSTVLVNSAPRFSLSHGRPRT
jgi:hypothetical protein